MSPLGLINLPIVWIVLRPSKNLALSSLGLDLLQNPLAVGVEGHAPLLNEFLDHAGMAGKNGLLDSQLLLGLQKPEK